MLSLILVGLTLQIKNQRGETLFSVLIAMGLMAILALFASTAIDNISRSFTHLDQQKRLSALDADIATLLTLPQVCTCNFANLAVPANLNSTIDLGATGISFYSDPPNCTAANAVPIAKVAPAPGAFIHGPSQLKVTAISLGPFHPLGASGDMLADFNLSAEGLVQSTGQFRPITMKVLLSTGVTAGGSTIVQFCGKKTGTMPVRAPAAYASHVLYRFSQYSLNFSCGNNTFHPIRVEPYIYQRVQYFWPAEEGDMITEFDTTRVGNAPIGPMGFAAFSGASVCYEEKGIADDVKLVVPPYNEKTQCAALQNTFLNGAPTIVDVGFSLADNCSSRF